MPHSVCPWWIGYILINPLRRLRDNPAKLLAPYVRPGMTVLEPGPGMGYFTLELARRVGPSGRVIAVDIQPRMLAKLRRRADRAGVLTRLDIRQALNNSLGVTDFAGKIDFVLAYAMVHEMPSADVFFREAAQAMKAEAVMLFAEPAGHVKPEEFDSELNSASRAGLSIGDGPSIRGRKAALLTKVSQGLSRN